MVLSQRSVRLFGAAALLAVLSAATYAAVTGVSILPVPLNPVVPEGQRQCTAKTASGLGYTVLRPTSAAKPSASDVVLVNYIGYLASNGEVFDQGTRSALPVGGVIPGFSEGLQLAPKGSVVRLCIPAALGYGAKGAGPIPANAPLVFQVEVIDFKSQTEVDAMQAGQANGEAASGPAPQ
jgi:FKBP-type peptidyl-prolyl cis-trans isomerase FkpA